MVDKIKKTGSESRHISHSHMANKQPTPTDVRNHLLEAVKGIDAADRPSHADVSAWFASGRPNCPDVPDFATQWTVAVLTMTILGVVHLYRFLTVAMSSRASGDHVTRETVILLLGATGLYLFWKDMHQCRVYDGMLKLIVFVTLANMVVPYMWITVPTRPPPKHPRDDAILLLEEEEEVTTMEYR